MALQLDDLDLLPPAHHLTQQPANGRPLMLPLDAIDEDPAQPRREFDAQALRELADTIAEHGVLQAISVRCHPSTTGRWMLNFGARRLRASRLAGKTVIPAFIDERADSYRQVIENEQRESLKPLELALFVQQRLQAGDSQAEIARRLGKSRQYVMVSTALINAPDWLLDAYLSGRCRGMNELHELRKLHGRHPQYVEAWASDREGINRESLQALRVALSDQAGSIQAGVSAVMKASSAEACQPESADARDRAGTSVAATAPEPAARSAARPRSTTQLSLTARLGADVVTVITDEAPAQAGQVFVVDAGGGTRREVEAARLTLLGFCVD
jgi:ParB family chromosome partitioning protein